jgi:hypothetical protein
VKTRDELMEGLRVISEEARNSGYSFAAVMVKEGSSESIVQGDVNRIIGALFTFMWKLNQRYTGE